MKLVATSIQRWRANASERRLHGGSTVTKFLVYRAEDRNDPKKWVEVVGYGKTPGERKTYALRAAEAKLSPLAENPKRPPKRWWRGCVRGVRDSGSAASPERVCGDLWYHRMSKAQRRRITREAEMKSNPCTTCKSQAYRSPPDLGATAVLRDVNFARQLEPNPIGLGGWLLILGAVGAVAWVLWPKTAEAKESAPPELPPPATCPIDAQMLDAWGNATGISVFYFPGATVLTPDMLAAIPTLPDIVSQGNVPVVVIADGSFWTATYATGLWLPAPAPAQKDAYCDWTAQQGQTAPPPQEPDPIVQQSPGLPFGQQYTP